MGVGGVHTEGASEGAGKRAHTKEHASAHTRGKTAQGCVGKTAREYDCDVMVQPAGGRWYIFMYTYNT